MPIRKNLVGMKFGRLTVVGEASIVDLNAIHWHCLCDCGNGKIASTSSLRSGNVKSCGCLGQERIEKLKSHGKSRGSDHKHTRLYSRWANIKDRCCNPNCKDFKNYGARGITICEEWKNNYLEFHDWALENGYAHSLQIDRIDNSQNYSPENCRWVSNKVNSNNRRNSINVLMFGMEKNLYEWEKETCIPYQTLWKHYKKGDLEGYILKRTNVGRSEAL